MKLFKFWAAKQAATAPVDQVISEDWRDRSLVASGTAVTVSEIVGHLQQAEQGEARRWFAFCDEMRARDAWLEAEMSRAEGMIAGARVDVLSVPAFYRSRSRSREVTGEAAMAAEVSAYVQDMLLSPSVRLDRAITGLMSGFWKGLGALQVVVEPEAKGERIVSLEPVPTQRFLWGYDSTELMVQPGGDWSVTRPVKDFGSSLVVFVPDAHVPSPARRGVLRRLVPFFMIRTKGPAWWARHVEVYGIPPLVGKYPSNDSVTKKALIAAFQAFGANAWLTVPEQAEIDKIEAASRGAGQSPHEAILDWTARQISTIVLGATQTTDVQPDAGSKASAGVHQDVVLARATSRAREIASCLREQLVFPMVERRFGKDVALVHTPELVLRVEQPPAVGEWAQAMKALVEAGFGASIPRSLVNEMGYAPQPEDGEETLVVQTQVPAQPPASGPPVVEGEGEEQTAARKSAPAPQAALLDLEAWAMRQAKGAGEELVAEVRSVIDQAERDGVTLQQLLARVMQTAPVPPEAPELVDLLAAVQLEATMRGFAGR